MLRQITLVSLAFACCSLYAQQAPSVSIGGSIGITGGQSREGQTAIAMADADYTMNANEWWAGTLVVTGSLTAPRNIIAPANRGQAYCVENQTSQTLTVTTAANLTAGVPGTVIVPSSMSMVCTRFDGTAYVPTSSSGGGGGGSSPGGALLSLQYNQGGNTFGGAGILTDSATHTNLSGVGQLVQTVTNPSDNASNITLNYYKTRSDGSQGDIHALSAVFTGRGVFPDGGSYAGATTNGVSYETPVFNNAGQHVGGGTWKCFGLGDCLTGGDWYTLAGGGAENDDAEGIAGRKDFFSVWPQGIHQSYGQDGGGSTWVPGSTRVRVSEARDLGQFATIYDVTQQRAVTLAPASTCPGGLPGTCVTVTASGMTPTAGKIFRLVTNIDLPGAPGIPTSQKPAANAVASIDTSGGVPFVQTSTSGIPSTGYGCFVSLENEHHGQYEYAQYTVTSATQITFPQLNRPHTPNAYFMVGDGCGLGLEVKALTTQNINAVQVIPVGVFTDATHAVIANQDGPDSLATLASTDGTIYPITTVLNTVDETTNVPNIAQSYIPITPLPQTTLGLGWGNGDFFFQSYGLRQEWSGDAIEMDQPFNVPVYSMSKRILANGGAHNSASNIYVAASDPCGSYIGCGGTYQTPNSAFSATGGFKFPYQTEAPLNGGAALFVHDLGLLGYDQNTAYAFFASDSGGYGSYQRNGTENLRSGARANARIMYFGTNEFRIVPTSGGPASTTLNDDGVTTSSVSTGQASAVGSTCTVGGYVTLTIDGVARKLAYCQ